jgi:hypothetical protein
MAEFDRLPQDLRQWLAAADLPWSAKSTLKLWNKALNQHGGNRAAALSYLTDCEASKIKKDAPEVWGASYPTNDLRSA